MSFSQLMVAPNGAYKTTYDHPNVPVTVAATVATAKACFDAGADALHAHVRDSQQQHVLDAGLYRELTSAMAEQVPHMEVQITTEAGGVYDAAFQRRFITDLMPDYISLSFGEMLRDTPMVDVIAFYRELLASPIKVQHIFYSAEQLQVFIDNILPLQPNWHLHHGLFVLGRYHAKQQSHMDDLTPFLAVMQREGLSMAWSICAFGEQQIPCLLAARKQGGGMRIGFENAWYDPQGNILQDNAALVAVLVSKLSD